MGIRENLLVVEERMSEACRKAVRRRADVTLVAVTKTVGHGEVTQAFECGVRHFGENRVQEAAKKLPLLGGITSEMTWHMVGRLQSNKVKSALSLFHSIDAIDSIRLAGLLDRNATERVPILLEVNVAKEPTKGGFAEEELAAAVGAVCRMPHLDLRGLMTVAPVAHDPGDVRPVFRRLRELRDALGLKELSMGMSEDYPVAIEEGATMIRIGRAIFGERRA
ncbi:MAG: YggS family pyridoxal phosphate-dependent enzyme [Dehalococcoidia bacterium]|nr:YggS family pyridoxal phosphate-dependent enzyme [Dehalococcoidia bacterium]